MRKWRGRRQRSARAPSFALAINESRRGTRCDKCRRHVSRQQDWTFERLLVATACYRSRKCGKRGEGRPHLLLGRGQPALHRRQLLLEAVQLDSRLLPLLRGVLRRTGCTEPGLDDCRALGSAAYMRRRSRSLSGRASLVICPRYHKWPCGPTYGQQVPQPTIIGAGSTY